LSCLNCFLMENSLTRKTLEVIGSACGDLFKDIL